MEVNTEIVVVLTMARSRSSLVAHVLEQHGVFWPNYRAGDQWNPCGYYEWARLKQYLRSGRQNPYDALEPSPPLKPALFKWAREDQWCGKRRLGFKVDAFAWPIFETFSAQYVLLHREPEDILDSIHRTPFMRIQNRTGTQWRRIIGAHHDEMRRFADDHPDVCRPLDTDEMMEDDRPLREIVRWLGYEYDPAVLRRARRDR